MISSGVLKRQLEAAIQTATRMGKSGQMGGLEPVSIRVAFMRPHLYGSGFRVDKPRGLR